MSMCVHEDVTVLNPGHVLPQDIFIINRAPLFITAKGQSSGFLVTKYHVIIELMDEGF